VLGRVERSARDADDPRDLLVALKQRHQRHPEGAGRTGDRHRQVAFVCHARSVSAAITVTPESPSVIDRAPQLRVDIRGATFLG
jgi:hypothetical protein